MVTRRKFTAILVLVSVAGLVGLWALLIGTFALWEQCYDEDYFPGTVCEGSYDWLYQHIHWAWILLIPLLILVACAWFVLFLQWIGRDRDPR